MWDWGLRLAVIASIIATAIFAQQQSNFAECQAHYNEINNSRTRYLTDATTQEREAERRADNAETAIFTSPLILIPREERTPEETEVLIQLTREYQQALITLAAERAEADTARKLNPVPPPPSQLCG